MKIVSVNIASVGVIKVKGADSPTGIFKMPAPGRLRIKALGLEGDSRVEPRKYGEADHAVYAFPREHHAYWQERSGLAPLAPGQLGENLTIEGLLEVDARVGDVLRVGSATLQVTHPRIPCRKLDARVGVVGFSRAFLRSRKVGFYLRVLGEGEVGAGDEITLLDRDAGSPTIDDFIRISQFDYWDAEGLALLLRARGLGPVWRSEIEEKLARTRSARGWFGERDLVVVRRDEDGEGFASYELRCVRGRNLAPFAGGQWLLLSPPGGTPQQVLRQSFPLASDPQDTSAYRVCARSDAFLEVGAVVRAAAPRGELTVGAVAPDAGRVTLLTRGLGVVLAAGVLAELGSVGVEARLLHDESDGLPRSAWARLRALCAAAPRVEARSLPAGALLAGIAALRGDVLVAGPSSFIESVRASAPPGARLRSEPLG